MNKQEILRKTFEVLSMEDLDWKEGMAENAYNQRSNNPNPR